MTGEVAVLDLLIGTALNGSGGDGSIRGGLGGHEVARGHHGEVNGVWDRSGRMLKQRRRERLRSGNGNAGQERSDSNLGLHVGRMRWRVV